MPEAYIHLRTAKAALKISNISCQSINAYLMGAQGPDPFFMYKYLYKAPLFTVRELGKKLHHEKCAEYLLALINLASTPAQQSYALGSLVHYATDTALHGFVEYVSQKGKLYGMRGGHGYFEMALDSELCYEDFGKRVLYKKTRTPSLITKDLAEICALIQKAVLEVFNYKCPIEPIADSFHCFCFYQRLFVSRFGIKRFIFGIAEIITGHKKGWLTAHCTNKHFKRNMPEVWRNPFTGAETDENISDLIYDAETKSAAFIKAADGYWNKMLNAKKLAAIIGNNDYTTGLECKKTQKEKDSDNLDLQKDDDNATNKNSVEKENKIIDEKGNINSDDDLALI